MKVKEFIEKLSVLEQDKDIWIVYDGGCGYVCEPDEILIYDGKEHDIFHPRQCKLGDYFFDVS